MFIKSKLFFILMFFGATIWSTYLLMILNIGMETKHWPVTEGKVLSSNAKRINHHQERYILEIKYSYSINNGQLVGNKISNSNVMLTRAEKDLKLKDYHPASLISVYYNPEKPSESYLITGVDYGVFILLIACIGMLIFSALNLRKLIKL